MTPGLSRRHFLHRGLVAAACGLARPKPTNANQSDATQASGDTNIDTHVYVGRWPFRQRAIDDSTNLVAEMRRNNVSQAWAGTFDGLLHKDIASANERLAETCSAVDDGLLVSFGTVNPTLPDWEEDVRRCHEVHRMPGIRLHPNYHGYTLDDARFIRLLQVAAKRKLIVQLVGWLDNEPRPFLQNLALQVVLAPLLPAVRAAGGVRVIVANGISTYKHNDTLLQELAALPNVVFDFGRMASSAGVDGLVRKVTADRVAMGSGAPLMEVKSAIAAVRESSLNVKEKAAVRSGNARRLLQKSSLRSE